MPDEQDKVEQRLKECIASQMGVHPEDLKPTTNFIEDLGADSLDLVEIVMTVEEELDVSISDQEAEKISTFGELVEYIKAAQK